MKTATAKPASRAAVSRTLIIGLGRKRGVDTPTREATLCALSKSCGDGLRNYSREHTSAFVRGMVWTGNLIWSFFSDPPHTSHNDGAVEGMMASTACCFKIRQTRSGETKGGH